MSKMVVDKDLAKSEDDRLDMLHQYFQESMEDGTIIDGKKMVNEAERLEVKHKAPLLLVNVCFTEDIIGQIKKYRNLLLRFCLEDQKVLTFEEGYIGNTMYV
jgi:translation initiation factor 5